MAFPEKIPGLARSGPQDLIIQTFKQENRVTFDPMMYVLYFHNDNSGKSKCKQAFPTNFSAKVFYIARKFITEVTGMANF